MVEAPNPGSRAAQDDGCICPVLDNNRGRWAPWPPDGWYMVEGCPVHSLEIDGAALPNKQAESEGR